MTNLVGAWATSWAEDVSLLPSDFTSVASTNPPLTDTEGGPNKSPVARERLCAFA